MSVCPIVRRAFYFFDLLYFNVLLCSLFTADRAYIFRQLVIHHRLLLIVFVIDQ